MQETEIKPDRHTKAKTKVGNYFVSNYPPFSFWNEKDIPCLESMLESPSPGLHHWVSIIMSLFAGSAVIFVISVFTPIRIRMMCGAIYPPP